MTTIRIVIAIAANLKWHLYQIDVLNTFLHRDLNEEVFMKIPQGLNVKNNKGNHNLVRRLNKSLYDINWHLGCGLIIFM